MEWIVLNWLYVFCKIIIVLLLTIFLQYFICRKYLKYGWLIPALSVLLFIYKLITLVYPSISLDLYTLNSNIVILHIGILIIYSMFFFISFSIYFIKRKGV